MIITVIGKERNERNAGAKTHILSSVNFVYAPQRLKHPQIHPLLFDLWVRLKQNWIIESCRQICFCICLIVLHFPTLMFSWVSQELHIQKHKHTKIKCKALWAESRVNSWKISQYIYHYFLRMMVALDSKVTCTWKDKLTKGMMSIWLLLEG